MCSVSLCSKNPKAEPAAGGISRESTADDVSFLACKHIGSNSNHNSNEHQGYSQS